MYYSVYQNNIPLQPQDNFAQIGKNSQIKARKSEQGSAVKITLRKYNFHTILVTSKLFALTRYNFLRQLSDLNEIMLQLAEIMTASDSIGTYLWELL